MSTSTSRSDAVVVFTVSLVLFLLGLCLLLLLHVSSMESMLKQHMDVVITLEDGLSLSQRELIINNLQQDERVLPNSITYTSKEDALEEMREDYLEGVKLSENPFSDIINFNLVATYYNEDVLSTMKATLSESNHIQDVLYKNDTTAQVSKNISSMAYILLISSLVFSILSIVLMINTLQLQLISDKSEILTMQVVGAKPSFIKRPYLHRAIRISIRATVIAAAGMLLLLLYVQFYLLADTAIINWLLYALVVFVMLVVSNFLLLAVTNNRLNAYLK